MVRSLREALDAAQFKDWEMPATQFGGIHLGYAVPRLRFPVPQCEGLRRLSVPPAPDSARARSGHGTHARRPARSPHAAEISAGESVRARRSRLPTIRSTRVLSPTRCASFRTRFLKRTASGCATSIESAVKNEVAPAYAKFAKFVREDYAPHGRLDPGVWALPDGEARYRFAVRHQTTTDFTPDQIHQLGLKSVAEIETQMLSIAKAQGFSDLKSFNDHIRQDPETARQIRPAIV